MLDLKLGDNTQSRISICKHFSMQESDQYLNTFWHSETTSKGNAIFNWQIWVQKLEMVRPKSYKSQETGDVFMQRIYI